MSPEHFYDWLVETIETAPADPMPMVAPTFTKPKQVPEQHAIAEIVFDDGSRFVVFEAPSES